MNFSFSSQEKDHNSAVYTTTLSSPLPPAYSSTKLEWNGRKTIPLKIKMVKIEESIILTLNLEISLTFPHYIIKLQDLITNRLELQVMTDPRH